MLVKSSKVFLCYYTDQCTVEKKKKKDEIFISGGMSEGKHKVLPLVLLTLQVSAVL